MNIFLWIVAGVLAGVLLLAGTMKIAVAKEKLLATMAWSEPWSRRRNIPPNDPPSRTARRGHSDMPGLSDGYSAGGAIRPSALRGGQVRYGDARR